MNSDQNKGDVMEIYRCHMDLFKTLQERMDKSRRLYLGIFSAGTTILLTAASLGIIDGNVRYPCKDRRTCGYSFCFFLDCRHP